MFKIECFVDDKHLPAVLHALAGKVMDVKTTPVVNAMAANGQLKAVTSGNTQDMFREWLKKNNLTRVNAKNIRQFQADIGRSALGYSNVLSMAQKAGTLKRAKLPKGSGAAYDVLPEKA